MSDLSKRVKKAKLLGDNNVLIIDGMLVEEILESMNNDQLELTYTSLRENEPLKHIISMECSDRASKDNIKDIIKSLDNTQLKVLFNSAYQREGFDKLVFKEYQKRHQEKEDDNEQ